MKTKFHIQVILPCALACVALVGCESYKPSLPALSMPKMQMPSVFKKSPPQEPAEIEKYGDYFYGKESGEPLSISESERLRQKKLYKNIVVQKGDTLYDVAERYNVESRDVIEANNLRPPYRLEAGESLKLPAAQFYVVQPGDSIYEVSSKKGVDMSRLAEINKLEKPYGIEPGQRLRLPFRTHWASAGSDVSDRVAGPVGVGDVEVAELDEKTSILKKDFSGKYKPRKLRYVEQQPDGREVEIEKSSVVVVEDNPPPVISSEPEVVETREVAALEPKPRVVKKAEPKKPLPQMLGKAPTNFSWPVKGKVIAAFGPRRGGLYNDGINIAAPIGTPVKAVADGVVIYADNGLEGYGKLVIVKHNGGWISSYAHNKEMVVKRGDKVKRGQTVSKVGESGRVDKPQLHFGLRKGREVVNPSDYLSG